MRGTQRKSPGAGRGDFGSGLKRPFISLVSKNLKATALGLQGTVAGLCTLMASVFSGYIWDRFGSFWTFSFSAAWQLHHKQRSNCPDSP